MHRRQDVDGEEEINRGREKGGCAREGEGQSQRRTHSTKQDANLNLQSQKRDFEATCNSELASSASANASNGAACAYPTVQELDSGTLALGHLEAVDPHHRRFMYYSQVSATHAPL